MARALRIDDGLDFCPTGVGADFMAEVGVALEGRPEGVVDGIWFGASLRFDVDEGYYWGCSVIFKPCDRPYGPHALPDRDAADRAEAEAYLTRVYEGIRARSIEIPLEA